MNRKKALSKGFVDLENAIKTHKCETGCDSVISIVSDESKRSLELMVYRSGETITLNELEVNFVANALNHQIRAWYEVQ